MELYAIARMAKVLKIPESTDSHEYENMGA